MLLYDIIHIIINITKVRPVGSGSSQKNEEFYISKFNFHSIRI